ncbi:Glutamyl-tRNA reductase [hydrothermal vent metagenome]|uniref:glutamyl-tRNA reductase n=1 Tax=hydrothermal vent metagenome TaxID=652676 RepID=A0A3B0QST8_9ZZZZ
MNLIIVGLNHRTAPVELREKLTFPTDAPDGTNVFSEPLKRLVTRYGINEAVILSTCNRVEIIGVAEDIIEGTREIKRFLSEYHDIPGDKLRDHLYVHIAEDAVKHLFRVSSGLDSMVVGEPQILGQVKDAYGHAVLNDTAGVVINKLFHKAFSVSKRIRTETRIGAAAVSISYAAVELAKKIFGDLQGKTVMLVGAGEMAELGAKHLLSAGVRDIVITNRTYERAVAMSREFGGKAVMFREMVHYLKNVDIVIASTGAPDFIIKADDVSGVMRERKHKPIFFIDISVPRNIDPLVNNIDNVYLFDIDNLQGVVEANLKERAKEAEDATLIVDEEIGTFYRWANSLDVVPTIIALRQQFEKIRKGEIEKAAGQLGALSDKELKAIDAMTTSIVNKILHDPISHLKQEASNVEGDMLIDVVRRLFDLDEEQEEKKSLSNSK